jgi:hypothetical protein
MESATVSCSDVHLSGRPIGGGASCKKPASLAAFYPVSGEGGSLPSQYFAACEDEVNGHACLQSVYLTCCIFDDNYPAPTASPY